MGKWRIAGKIQAGGKEEEVAKEIAKRLDAEYLLQNGEIVLQGELEDLLALFRPGKLYRPAEIARKLGIGRATVYAWVKQGKLPAVRTETTVRIRGEDVNRLLEGKNDLQRGT